jgi:hypothetical protein
MDDFSIFTIREPWLLKEISTAPASTWLVGRNLMLLGRRDLRQETNSTEISKRPLRRKRKATKRVPKFSCTKDNFMRELQNNLAHTLLNLQMIGVDNFLFLRCKIFKLIRCTRLWRHYAHAHAVWCSWCTLEWLGYPYDELVIAKAIIGREGIWMASRFLTTKIPSALLMAVVRLQHTRCPRYRRGTVGYGITHHQSREVE